MRILAAALAFALAASTAAAEDKARKKEKGSVSAEVHVGRILVDAMVLDEHGAPIPDLGPADFQAKVAGKKATVEAAEWIPAPQAEGPAVTAEGTRNAEGRVLVLLVEHSMGGGRNLGILRVLNFAEPLVKSLVPSDRVAVLSWTGHLRLVQDFTADPAKVRSALRVSVLGGNVDDPGPDGPFPSLASELTEDVIETTETMEKGLVAIAEALGTIGGAKSLVFVGWGLAVNRAPSEYGWLGRADEALRASRTSVFTLDPSDADFHTLEYGLQNLSASTGGLYEKTNVFPKMAVTLVTKALAGRYVLVLVAPEGPTSPVDLTLVGRKGTVTARGRG